jgi:hypothetical protein
VNIQPASNHYSFPSKDEQIAEMLTVTITKTPSQPFGVELVKQEDGAMTVTAIAHETPAAGLVQIGDVIHEFNGEPTQGLSFEKLGLMVHGLPNVVLKVTRLAPKVDQHNGLRWEDKGHSKNWTGVAVHHPSHQAVGNHNKNEIATISKSTYTAWPTLLKTPPTIAEKGVPLAVWKPFWKAMEIADEAEAVPAVFYVLCCFVGPCLYYRANQRSQAMQTHLETFALPLKAYGVETEWAPPCCVFGSEGIAFFSCTPMLSRG